MRNKCIRALANLTRCMLDVLLDSKERDKILLKITDQRSGP